MSKKSIGSSLHNVQISDKLPVAMTLHLRTAALDTALSDDVRSQHKHWGLREQFSEQQAQCLGSAICGEHLDCAARGCVLRRGALWARATENSSCSKGAGPRVWSETELLDGDTSSQHAPSSPNFWGIE